MEKNVIILLPSKNNRIKGHKYMSKNNKIVIWSGTRLHCEHNRKKSQCKDCGGSGICEHNKRKSQCKDCGGSSICEHGRQKSLCKDCGGSSFCEHNKLKSRCNDCSPNSAEFCSNCKYIIGTKRYISKTDTYEKLCADCFYKLYPDVDLKL